MVMDVAPDLESFAQAYTIPLDNERDRRVLSWLRSTVGDDAIRDAIGRLAGRRKPFVSNLCRVLGVEVPIEVVEPSATGQGVRDAAHPAALPPHRSHARGGSPARGTPWHPCRRWWWLVVI